MCWIFVPMCMFISNSGTKNRKILEPIWTHPIVFYCNKKTVSFAYCSCIHTPLLIYVWTVVHFHTNENCLPRTKYTISLYESIYIKNERIEAIKKKSVLLVEYIVIVIAIADADIVVALSMNTVIYYVKQKKKKTAN